MPTSGLESSRCAALRTARKHPLRNRPSGLVLPRSAHHGNAVPDLTGILENAFNCIVGNRFKLSGCRRSKACANAVFAISCCLENMRWPDFFDWWAGHAPDA